MRKVKLRGLAKVNWLFYDSAFSAASWSCGSVPMMNVLSGILVVAFGLFLIGLAALIELKPQVAERFLRAFASTARAHYAEQALRLIAGGALVIFAPSLWFADLFKLFGWLIVVTAVALLLLPWRWHHELGKRVMPSVIRRMRLFALVAFALGMAVFYGASRAVR
jgi:hypothetical protein